MPQRLGGEARGRGTGGTSPSATVGSTLPRAGTQKRQKTAVCFSQNSIFSLVKTFQTKTLVRVQKDKCCKKDDLSKTKCPVSFTQKPFIPSPCSMSEKRLCRLMQILQAAVGF